jgi:hypothetical protein
MMVFNYWNYTVLNDVRIISNETEIHSEVMGEVSWHFYKEP